MHPHRPKFLIVWLICLLPCVGILLDTVLPSVQAQMSGGGQTGGLNPCDNLCRERMYFDQPNGSVGKPCLRFAIPTCTPCSGGNSGCVQRAGDLNTNSTCNWASNQNFLTRFTICNDLCTPGTLNFVEADTQMSGDSDPAVPWDVYRCT